MGSFAKLSEIKISDRELMINEFEENHFADMLGSVRTVTDAVGAVVECRDYMPFGRMLSSVDNGRGAAGCHPAAPDGGVASRTAQGFTGKERDDETGLDYFGARYMSSPEGRFMSPDPLMASASVSDPQSWNRYVYARNNPLRYNDPLGLFPSPAYNCPAGASDDACLNDEQRRILENSKLTIDGKDLSGEELWKALGEDRKNGEARQNAFVNITNLLASHLLENGSTALSQISGLTDIKVDRLYAITSPGLADALESSPQFTSVSAGDHAPYNAVSYKNTGDVRGNIQISFDKGRTGADVDIDLGNWASPNPLGKLIHIGEVLQNKITGTHTNQDKVREILMRNPAVAITPSTDGMESQVGGCREDDGIYVCSGGAAFDATGGLRGGAGMQINRRRRKKWLVRSPR
jgi:RHS repeat-associated protein